MQTAWMALKLRRSSVIQKVLRDICESCEQLLLHISSSLFIDRLAPRLRTEFQMRQTKGFNRTPAEPHLPYKCRPKTRLREIASDTSDKVGEQPNTVFNWHHGLQPCE